MRHPTTPLAVACAAAVLLLAAPCGARAEGWTGTGELGIAAARGNARSESLNAKLDFTFEDEQWKHAYRAAALRARGEVTGDFDGDGVAEERFELNANRYELAATSAYKLDQRRSWLAALRYENDDFAPYAHQATVAIGYGHQFIDDGRTLLATELGPGWRRAEKVDSGETESDLILRGKLDFKRRLTDTTELVNTLLVESGDDNTFAQNDLGLAVKINSSLALKTALQFRHNTEVEPGVEKTDSLLTVNLVYTFK